MALKVLEVLPLHAHQIHLWDQMDLGVHMYQVVQLGLALPFLP